MAALVIIEFTIHDPILMDEYRKIAGPSVETFGGKFIVRGGKTTYLEGGWEPQRIVIIEFASQNRAQEWWNSDLYNKAKIFRDKAAHTKMIIVDLV